MKVSGNSAYPRVRTYLDFRDDLLFGRVGVTTVHDADDVRLCALHKSNCGPKHTFPTAARIAVLSLSTHRQQKRARWGAQLTSTDERNL